MMLPCLVNHRKSDITNLVLETRTGASLVRYNTIRIIETGSKRTDVHTETSGIQNSCPVKQIIFDILAWYVNFSMIGYFCSFW